MKAPECWRRQQALAVHGWIYDVRDGLLRDLGCTITTPDEIAPACTQALQKSPRTAPTLTAKG